MSSNRFRAEPSCEAKLAVASAVIRNQRQELRRKQNTIEALQALVSDTVLVESDVAATRLGNSIVEAARDVIAAQNIEREMFNREPTSAHYRHAQKELFKKISVMRGRVNRLRRFRTIPEEEVSEL